MLAFLLGILGVGVAGVAADGGGKSPNKPDVIAIPTKDNNHTPRADVPGDADTGDRHTPRADVPGDADTGDHHTPLNHGVSGFTPINAPETEAEIDAFVTAVIDSPEKHVHDAGSSKMDEHMAALNLTPRDEATHIAIGHGDWDDPANWYNGEVPGDNARVLVPEGIHITYDHVSDARLFTLRVDGKLEFATDTDSQMVVDTIVIAPDGTLQIGSEAEPVAPDVNVDIIFANNGPIDTDWDPMLLSRGMIAHGTTEIYGATKDSHDKVAEDPKAGDTWVDFGETPEGWAVGDTIVIAGTHYEGHYNITSKHGGYEGSQDEVRVITEIEDGMVFFDESLEYDHDTPREDLKTSVANYTRNVSFETEDADTAEIYERGHVMFMHNDDVDVHNAEFHELGRTDKSETSLNVGDYDSIDFDTNVKGRYSFHFHRAGVDDLENPAIATGNAVYGSPGWGFVHHDSNAILDNNATFDTFGAGYVAESGNETGAWTDNIAIYAKGTSWLQPKLAHSPEDIENFDLAKSGDGFWFQGRMIESNDNIAASVNQGFVYFHRGPSGEDGNIGFQTDTSDISGALNAQGLPPDKHPILEFNGNETFAANRGLAVVKANPNQGHDIHSVLEDFTAWEVREGAFLEYTAHYTLIDFDLIGKEGTDLSGKGSTGILFGPKSLDMSVVDTSIENFNTGINLQKEAEPTEAFEYNIVNVTFEDVDTEYKNFDPSTDTIMSADDLPLLTPDIILNGPLTYKDGNPYVDPEAGRVAIQGTKQDSLGETDFPGGIDNYDVLKNGVIREMEETGFYSTSDGQNYYLKDIYFSDRMTGDIYVETHPVLLDENVLLSNKFLAYKNVPYNGVRELDSDDDLSFDAAKLWATLTEGQLVLTDEALEMEAEEEEPELKDA